MGNSASVPLRVRRRRSEDPSARDLLCTKPSGLYPTCPWDPKLVRRLILRGELAPRYVGLDEPTLDAHEECPICMLVYPVLNETRCCAARLCTECYLQIRPPRHNKEPCPFCKYKRVEASYKGPRDQNDIERERMDEKRALEAMKRANLAASASTSSSPTSGSISTNSLSRNNSSTTSTVAAVSSTTGSVTVPETTPAHFCPSRGAGAQSLATDSRSPCACPDSSETACSNDHRARYYHDQKSTAIDPLVLEAMASEVTYSNSGLERGSASSSDVLDSQAKSLHSGVSSASINNAHMDSAASPSRVVRLPWYGGEVSLENAGPSAPMTLRPVDEFFHEDEVSLNEAIRRSLIDM